MTTLTTELIEQQAEPHRNSNGHPHAELNGRNGKPVPPVLDMEFLRRCGWEIGEARSAEVYTPPTGHVGLATITPTQGFAHWRILLAWVEHTSWLKGDAWKNCRLILRMYDVTCIDFNGFNACRIQDHDLPGLAGDYVFKLPRGGTWQLAEVGYLLRNGEFIPAARSQAVSFSPGAPSAHSSQAALFVDPPRRVEEIGNVWEQERILRELSQPRLRKALRCASFAFASLGSGQNDWLATFVTELAAGQCSHGHEAHVFVPANHNFRKDHQTAGVHYHPLDVRVEGTPLEQANAFRLAAENRLRDFQAFDLIHLHEWMTGVGRLQDHQATIRSISSTEGTRRGNHSADELSRQIEMAERAAAQSADCVLTPHWLRDHATAELGLEKSRVHAFPMEGRLVNEWEAPLDYGHVKMNIGLGPLDRMILFIGPLEHSAGVDLVLDALPVLLSRAANLRVVYVGNGTMYGHLHQRSHQIGVSHAVRMLGHVEGTPLSRLLRASEALVLPSRCRVPHDDAVVDLARRAGRPVVTTHAGPAYLIRHEENGIVTYDNPGSMVWALDRILGDPTHAGRMGRNGLRQENSAIRWSDVAHCYMELCAAQFPQLTERLR